MTVAIQLVSEGHKVPFSKALLATTLSATGLPRDRAFNLAMGVEQQLIEACTGVGEVCDIDVERLRELVETLLGHVDEGPYLKRYRLWNRLARDDRPIVILIGGATGAGKSTIAAQLAGRLGVVRMISTDSIREIMRAFFSESLMPVIHHSSYEAGQGVRIPLGAAFDSHVVGFMEQVDVVNVGVLALLERAMKERTSLIVEGVHMVPGMLASAGARERISDVVVLQLVVAVKDLALHKSHFLVREQQTSGRRAIARYLENFEEIRKIQDFILERARAEGTLVVENVNIDETVGVIIDALYEAIEAIEGTENA
jgi:2-phosphoglycerate kinase